MDEILLHLYEPSFSGFVDGVPEHDR